MQVFALGCVSGGSTPEPAAAARAVEQVDAIAAAALDGRHAPGLSLAVLQGADLVLARGYGRQDVTDSRTV